MIINWLMARLPSYAKIDYCCGTGRSDKPELDFKDAIRAWTPIVAWAPLGVHIIVFILFGPPLSDGGRIDWDVWTVGLLLYAGVEMLIEVAVWFKERLPSTYADRLPLAECKLPAL